MLKFRVIYVTGWAETGVAETRPSTYLGCWLPPTRGRRRYCRRLWLFCTARFKIRLQWLNTFLIFRDAHSKLFGEYKLEGFVSEVIQFDCLGI